MMICSDCPYWHSEPIWKQMLYVWRGGLWLGRCDHNCYKGELSWWGQPCGHRDKNGNKEFHEPRCGMRSGGYYASPCNCNSVETNENK